MSFFNPSLQDGEVAVGFSTPRAWNPLSAFVRWLSASEVSHAWLLYYDDDLGLTMVMEATELGFRLVPLEFFVRKNRIKALAHPGWDLNQGIRHVACRIGGYYDFGGLLGMAWVLLGRWVRRKWRNPFSSSRALFCAEAVNIVLRASEFPGVLTLPAPEESTPQDILDFLKSRCASMEAP